MHYTTYSSTDSTDGIMDDSSTLCMVLTYVDEYKSEEDDLWEIVDRREWRKHIKASWLCALGAKQYFCAVRYLVRMLYYRRLLFSISGWVARVGQNKRN